MRRVFIATLFVALLFSFGAWGQKTRTLYFFNWSDYIDPELVKEFERIQNCKVNTPSYDFNLTKLEQYAG
jgi:spermidine/putrescine-binding protein